MIRQPSDATGEHQVEHNLPPEIGPYLEARVTGLGTYAGNQKFPDGQSNPTYLVSGSKDSFVLRARPPGKLIRSAHRVDREFRVMRALSASDVAVPETVFLSGDDNPLGRQFFVMRHVEGRVFWNPALPGIPAEERGQVYSDMIRTLASLHSVDPDLVGLSDFGRPRGYIERQAALWISLYRQAEEAPEPLLDQVIPWLEENVPADDGSASIVHGDFRIDNVIFRADRPEVAAVLDWELSTLGHPVSDLANLCAQQRLPNEGFFMRGLAGVDRRSVGIPEEKEIVEQYCSRMAMSFPADWTFHTTFSLFRLAAILAGVRSRAIRGNASNPDKAFELSKAIPVLAELAVAGLDRS